jgi:hypothetical protein
MGTPFLLDTDTDSPPVQNTGGLQINPALLDKSTEKLPEGVYPEGTPVPDDREHLFTLDRRMYTAPRKVQPYLMFRFLRDIKKQGMMEASAGLMTDLLSDAVMDVLAEATELTEEEAKTVFRIITKYMEKNANRLMGN